MSRTRPRKRYRPSRMRLTYTAIDELRASPVDPLPAEWRRHQLTRMYEGLHAIETAPQPTDDDLRVVTDATNLLETLIAMGEAQDPAHTLRQAMAALAVAFARARESGAPIRIDSAHLQTVRGALEDYAALLGALPARTVIHAHRKTEQRIQAILRGAHLPHDHILNKS